MNSGFFKGFLTALILALTLTSCGFHLRGSENLPFETLYIQDSGAQGIAHDLRKALKSNGVTLASSAESAQASLELMSENLEKRILSLSGNGTVREYELIYRVTFRVHGQGGTLWGRPQTVEQRRDFSYNDSALLSKGAEETRLNNDMRSEAVREVLRRVGSLSKALPE